MENEVLLLIRLELPRLRCITPHLLPVSYPARVMRTAGTHVLPQLS